MEIDALFHARQVGTTGHEIVNPAGQVVAWTVDECWASVFVALLNEHTSQKSACICSSGSVRFEEVSNWKCCCDMSYLRNPASPRKARTGGLQEYTTLLQE